MAMASPGARFPIGAAGKLKILLLVLASLFVIGMLFYSGRITDTLLERERKVVALYARSLEFIAANNPQAGDVSFAFEVIQAIDFPIILSNPADSALYWRNIDADTSGMSDEARTRFFREMIAQMDSSNKPIQILASDSLVVNIVHYGESRIIRQLRWLPVSELSIAFIIVIIAYAGFSYIKRSEQSSIWVGMAKETAHQLGTPLSSMMGWLERLKGALPAGSHQTETLLEMERDVERLNKVAARFSKIGSKPDIREEDLSAVIEGVISYIARRLPRTGKKIDLVLETPGTFHARINRELFEWVIENLMKNALDAMEGPTGKISFAIATAGSKVTIDVTDTGKGIDPKFHKEVFRPGYSTKKRGWGLGLSLSKRIIEDYHGGRLFVKSSLPGQGTTFRIRLTR
jgi:signal transduction histidine kinase